MWKTVWKSLTETLQNSYAPPFWPFQRLCTHTALQGHLAEASSGGEDRRSALQGERVWLPPVQHICPLKFKLNSGLVFAFSLSADEDFSLAWFVVAASWICPPTVPIVPTCYPKPSYLFFPPQGYLAEPHPFHPLQRHPSVLDELQDLALCCMQVPWIIIYKQWILKLENKHFFSLRAFSFDVLSKPEITGSLWCWCYSLGHCVCTDGERIFQPGEEGAPGGACKPGQRGPGAVRALADGGVSATYSSGWKGTWEGRGLGVFVWSYGLYVSTSWTFQRWDQSITSGLRIKTSEVTVPRKKWSKLHWGLSLMDTSNACWQCRLLTL